MRIRDRNGLCRCPPPAEAFLLVDGERFSLSSTQARTNRPSTLAPQPWPLDPGPSTLDSSVFPEKSASSAQLHTISRPSHEAPGPGGAALAFAARAGMPGAWLCSLAVLIARDSR